MRINSISNYVQWFQILRYFSIQPNNRLNSKYVTDDDENNLQFEQILAASIYLQIEKDY